MNEHPPLPDDPRLAPHDAIHYRPYHTGFWNEVNLVSAYPDYLLLQRNGRRDLRIRWSDMGKVLLRRYWRLQGSSQVSHYLFINVKGGRQFSVPLWSSHEQARAQSYRALIGTIERHTPIIRPKTKRYSELEALGISLVPTVAFIFLAVRSPPWVYLAALPLFMLSVGLLLKAWWKAQGR